MVNGLNEGLISLLHSGQEPPVLTANVLGPSVQNPIGMKAEQLVSLQASMAAQARMKPRTQRFLWHPSGVATCDVALRDTCM